MTQVYAQHYQRTVLQYKTRLCNCLHYLPQQSFDETSDTHAKLNMLKTHEVHSSNGKNELN